MSNQHDLPLFLDLAKKPVLVVGGGVVAERKINSLLESGAQVTVIAPDATGHIRNLAQLQTVTWIDQEFAAPDLRRDKFWLAITATGVASVDNLVVALCEADRLWCVNCAASDKSSAVFAAQGKTRDGIQIAVSGNRDPKRAVAVRDAILYELALGLIDPGPQRRTRLTAAQVRSSLSQSDLDENSTATGQVTLVGAGPGDPELITVRGLARIRQADVVVVDRLAPQALWRKLPLGIEIIKVGKAPGEHSATQSEINEVIVDRALSGKRVVRIKGGDSFVLGRGGEEAQACVAAGIPVEVVPGITSSIAVPAAAGIPVTQRGITASFTMASAHEGAKSVLAAIGGTPVDSTLVLLMGASKLTEICRELIGIGYSPTTPLAVVESGLTPEQNVTEYTLSSALAQAVRPKNPSVVVIGEVVRMRQQLGDLAPASLQSGFLDSEPNSLRESATRQANSDVASE